MTNEETTMTNSEAIDIIKCLAWHTRPNEEDIEQAIKALESPSCDCVSRKDVIILIDEATELHPYKVIGDSETYSDYNQGWEDACNWLYANIDSDNLKSVTPQQKVGKWTCTDDMDEYYGKLSRCSVCGSKVLEADRYCPYCGSYNGGGEE